MTAPMEAWLAEPMSAEVTAQLERIRRAPGVRRVAVMPDVHLAHDVCIGTVVAAEDRVFPACVGGDIGCGVATVRFDGPASAVDDAGPADAILGLLAEMVPVLSQRRGRRHALPERLANQPLRLPGVDRLRSREAIAQLGTVGRGNHFVELQADLQEEGRPLWALVHSGSRCVGPAIRDAVLPSGGLASLEAGSALARDYLADAAWAEAYAEYNRTLMLHAVAAVIHRVVGYEAAWDTHVDCNHNHVRLEDGLWVHRKGAIHAEEGRPGIIPGSMGASTYHTLGRGCHRALRSCSHGAGRAMSRTEARRGISPRRLQREMRGVWFVRRRSAQLVGEAPSAYRDIGRVMRAQRELVKVVRVLRPVLSYKGA